MLPQWAAVVGYVVAGATAAVIIAWRAYLAGSSRARMTEARAARPVAAARN